MRKRWRKDEGRIATPTATVNGARGRTQRRQMVKVRYLTCCTPSPCSLYSVLYLGNMETLLKDGKMEKIAT